MISSLADCAYCYHAKCIELPRTSCSRQVFAWSPKNTCESSARQTISIWTSNLASREGNEPNQGDELMAIGLTFEEYVEMKLMPPKHAVRAFVTAAEHMRDEAFPMSLAQAAWHARTRDHAYGRRLESLELLVKQYMRV